MCLNSSLWSDIEIKSDENKTDFFNLLINLLDQ